MGGEEAVQVRSARGTLHKFITVSTWSLRVIVEKCIAAGHRGFVSRALTLDQLRVFTAT